MQKLRSRDAGSNFVANFLVARFSTDEGQCWKSYNFTEQPFFFAGLASEPGTKALSVSVWGFRPEDDSQPMWVAVTIDFQSLITRECECSCPGSVYLGFRVSGGRRGLFFKR